MMAYFLSLIWKKLFRWELQFLWNRHPILSFRADISVFRAWLLKFLKDLYKILEIWKVIFKMEKLKELMKKIDSRIHNELAQLCVLTTEYCEILEWYKINVEKDRKMYRIIGNTKELFKVDIILYLWFCKFFQKSSQFWHFKILKKICDIIINCRFIFDDWYFWTGDRIWLCLRGFLKYMAYSEKS